jgi:hypothetical protein
VDGAVAAGFLTEDGEGWDGSVQYGLFHERR